MVVNECRREHVSNGDVLLDQWDQAAVRALMDAELLLPVSSGDFITVIHQRPDLEGHFHGLENAWESSRRLHATMIKLQILGLVDPKKDSSRKDGT